MRVDLSDKEIPPKLYKYRAIKNKNSFYKYDEATRERVFSDQGLLALSEGKVWFSDLKTLNDPYECVVTFEKKNKYTDYLKRLQEKLYVYSLSESNINSLLWAHYADAHQGYCLEFEDVRQTVNDEKFDYDDNHGTYCVQRVKYKNNCVNCYDVVCPNCQNKEPIRPRWNKPIAHKCSTCGTELGLLCNNVALCMQKTTEWKYEEECRVVCYSHKHIMNGFLAPIPGKLTAIYFGARMTPDCINAIKDAVSRGAYGYTIKYKKARPSHHIFKIEFDDIGEYSPNNAL